MNTPANLPDYSPLGPTVGRAIIPTGLPTLTSDAASRVRAILWRLRGCDAAESGAALAEAESELLALIEAERPRL